MSNSAAVSQDTEQRDIPGPPLVSIVMPVFNAAGFLKAAVEGARMQSWPALELIAVNDGATDGSGEVLEELACRWTGEGRTARVIHQQNAGAAAARNLGLELATGDFVALFDADDLYDPDLISACMNRLLADQSADVAFALSRILDGQGRIVHHQTPLPPRLDALDLLDGRMVNRPVLRRAAALAVGGHNPSLRVGIDLDLFLRMALRRPSCIVTVPVCLSDYRRREGQITANWRNVEQGWLHGCRTYRAARPDIPRRRLRRAHARKCLYWAELAYAAGHYADARQLIWTACRYIPREVLLQPQGRIRLASCLASFLPEPVHAGLRQAFNIWRTA